MRGVGILSAGSYKEEKHLLHLVTVANGCSEAMMLGSYVAVQKLCLLYWMWKRGRG